MMKSEYREGQEAIRNFEEGMKVLFKVPKDEVVRAERRKMENAGASRRRKKKASDED